MGPSRKQLEGVQEELISMGEEVKDDNDDDDDDDDEFHHPDEISPEFRDSSSGKQFAPKVPRKFQKRTFTSSKQLGDLLQTPADHSGVREFTIYETPAGQHKRGVASANNLSFEAGPGARSTVEKLATPGSTRRNLIFSGGSGYQPNTTFSEDGMDLMGLLNVMGHAYKLLCGLKCEEAFNAL